MIEFKWKLKQKPEDFIVYEIAEHNISSDGNFFIYKLIKKNFTTLEIAEKYKLSYAGLKDKRAITFQYVSTTKDIGNLLINKEQNRFYILQKLGKTQKKIKIGNLKANRFNIKIPVRLIHIPKTFINYYDTQRIHLKNISKGKEILLKGKKVNSKVKNLIIDSYISYLWNESLKLFITQSTTYNTIISDQYELIFPACMDNIPKYWSLLGYKIKLTNSEEYFYKKILSIEGIQLDTFLDTLRKLKIKGSYRRVKENVYDINIASDYLGFSLKKGAYATTLIKFLYLEYSILKSS